MALNAEAVTIESGSFMTFSSLMPATSRGTTRAISSTLRVGPVTSQHALREGRAVAENVAATILGRDKKPFRFSTFGQLPLIGHRTGSFEHIRHQIFRLLPLPPPAYYLLTQPP